jgi:hypothetical protein
MDWMGRERHKLRTEELALVGEARALLSGTLVAHVGPGSVGMPTWARVNWLAHAHPAVLLHEFDVQRNRAPQRSGSWARTNVDILQELVELAAGESPLIQQLQRGCLIPLELRLMEPPLSDVLPSEVLVLALTRLHAHPIALRHPSVSPPET